MSQVERVSHHDQRYIQDFNQLCLTAAEEQNKSVTGQSDQLEGLLNSCRLMQSAIRDMAARYDEPVESLLARIAEFGMMVAERPGGRTGKMFFEEVQAACRELGFEAVHQDI